MKTVDDYEAIRRAFYLEGMSIREISRTMHHGRAVIRKAIAHSEPEGYTLSQPREAPVLDPFKARIQELLQESEAMRQRKRQEILISGFLRHKNAAVYFVKM